MTDLLDDDGLLDLRKRARDVDGVVAEERSRWDDLPPSNQALAAWDTKKPALGRCHVCDHPPRMTCRSCHKQACGSHSWVMLGVCRACATEDRVARWNKEKQASDKNWLEDA